MSYWRAAIEMDSGREDRCEGSMLGVVWVGQSSDRQGEGTLVVPGSTNGAYEWKAKAVICCVAQGGESRRETRGSPAAPSGIH
ncbi:unnamed protein product [Clonostachys rosea f. rosea IK726]|uniref:Uncharacterized protein n=1 Tax=Clonostachys rosea f. rosea IK726 TaxID=1349383 RepID=A0ACA9T9F2_BIOOC|nr:unnamed protein product [Clonostachys rosea f. rosea IK726]